MTALRDYALLECVGWYAEAPDAAAQEVVVSFGDATLTIQLFDETPLAHWPLATLTRQAGAHALTLAPDADAPERLGLDDVAMIDALRRIDAAGPPARPPRVSRRLLLRLATVAIVATLVAAGWRHAPQLTAALALQTPVSARAAIGDAAVAAYAGPMLCSDARAEPVLRRLGAALSQNGAAPSRVWLVDRPATALAAPAPGGRIMLSAPAMRAAPDPDGIAAALRDAAAVAASRPPIIDAAGEAGVAALGALVSGLSVVDALSAAAARVLGAQAAHGSAGTPASPATPPALSREDVAVLLRACRTP